MNEATQELLNKLLFPRRKYKFGYIFLITILLLAGDYLVDNTGGTHLAYLHVMYFPVVIAGLAFSIYGGIITGIIAGILLGPGMFMNTEFLTSQPLSSWVIRLTVFACVGALSGLGASMFRSYLKELENKRITNPVSGLPNLSGLKIIFEGQVDQGIRPITVIVIDLFQMGRIDRALGADGTDNLIRQVAQNLVNELGDLCTVGHLHSKRFTLLVPDDNNLQLVLEKCNNVANKDYQLENIPIFVEMHFGIATYPDDDKDLASLTRKGRLAIDSAKNHSQRFGYFETETAANAERNLLLLHQLSRAIESRTLDIFYQPQINLQTGETIGLEALTRWTDPILGTVPPMDFIPLTEETTLINPFTKWLIEETAKKTRELHDAGHHLQVATNFSMKNFLDESVLSTLYETLEKYKIDPKHFELEVTETAVAMNINNTAEILTELRKRGLRIAVDDFGTGQASQHYLLELPVDVIKIDMLFVGAMMENSAAAAIVRSSITLGHELGLEVVAEGVETKEQAEQLKKWGCDVAQGYYFSKPIPAQDVISWLESMEKTVKAQ